ncbi:MAG: hypothetical protein JNK82_19665 [Myxococcaceae bacterium]|nr:hypothetical protein [Myxococcaceae bacterium]
MSSVLVWFPGLVALAAWLLAFVSAVSMVKHRSEGVSRFWLMTHGIAFFTGTAFKPEAAPHRRRFLIGIGVFFGALVLMSAMSAVLGA